MPPDPPTMGRTYKSYETPSTAPPPIFHVVSATVCSDIKIFSWNWNWVILNFCRQRVEAFPENSPPRFDPLNVHCPYIKIFLTWKFVVLPRHSHSPSLNQNELLMRFRVIKHIYRSSVQLISHHLIFQAFQYFYQLLHHLTPPWWSLWQTPKIVDK